MDISTSRRELHPYRSLWKLRVEEVLIVTTSHMGMKGQFQALKLNL